MEPWIPAAGLLMGAVAVALLVRLLLELEALPPNVQAQALSMTKDTSVDAKNSLDQLPKAA